MNLKNIKVYHLFWCIGAIILLGGLLSPDGTLDINVHDTYFVIAHLHVAVVLFLFFFLNGLGYWFVEKVLKRRLERLLTWIHAVIVMGSFIVYWLVVFYIALFPANPDFPLLDYDDQIINIVSVFSIMLTVFIAVPVYITNLLIGIFKLRKTL